MPLETAYRSLEGETYQHSPPPGTFPKRPTHVIRLPDQNTARWNHIDDLDTFFTRVYQYHQQHGFLCMMTRQCLELFQFLFVAVFSLFLITCVDYDRLFNRAGDRSRPRPTLPDVILPAGQCMADPPALVVVCLLVAAGFWLLRLLKVGYNFSQFWEIKTFYNSALGISDSELDNRTWYEVQRRLQDVQRDQQMCIHKSELTELDIYNRILRFKNYMVAMVNKQVLPLKFQVPFLGEVAYLSKGLKYNLELLLFWGPGSPFENNWHLKADYKRMGKRRPLAQELQRRILWVGVVNLLLGPLILLWQLLYCFYNYAELIKREPGSLGMRRWSLYGRFFLRHFNELDHELNTRLNMGYKASNKYIGSFSSPLAEIIAQNVMFVSGALLAVLIALTLYDEDVLYVEHMVPLISVLSVGVAVCRAFIADENLVFAPEQLMSAVLAHVHYVPDAWRGTAHTQKTMHQFSQLFQLKAYFLLEEVLSPIVTPLILCFSLRPRAQQIVDFYRNFTVDVVGVGDVCSFAQMDVRRHGHPAWGPVVGGGGGGGGGGAGAPETDSGAEETPEAPAAPAAAAADGGVEAAADHGKTELSLMHFAITNPGWRPPLSAGAYISTLRAQGAREAANLSSQQRGLAPLAEENALFSSLRALGSLGYDYTPIAAGLVGQSLDASGGSLLASVHGGLSGRPGGGDLAQSLLRPPPTIAAVSPSQLLPDFGAAEMAVSAIYMHEIHQRTLQQQSRLGAASPPPRYGGVDTPGTSVRYAATTAADTAAATSEHRPLLDFGAGGVGS